MNDYVPYLIALVILVIFSGYFSATETAFSAFNKTRMRTLAEKGNKKAALVLELSEKYDKVISTILVGNNIVNIGASSLATVMFIKMLGDSGATVSTVVLTIVILIFGEITPKSIAKDAAESFSMFAAPLLRILMVVLTPINAIFSAWKKLLSRLFHLDKETRMSQEELLMIVDEAQQEGGIDDDESESEEMVDYVIEDEDEPAFNLDDVFGDD